MPKIAQADLIVLVRTEFRNLPLRELLSRPPRVLLGVSAAAAAALEELGINTVFDLATSGVFDDASRLVKAGEDLKSVLFQYGAPTSDLVREGPASGLQVGELQYLPLSVLQRVSVDDAADLQIALDVQSVRDLAHYPPYRAALALLSAVYFPENAPDFDPERPADLLPKSGEYPTERVQYSTLLLDEIPLEDGAAIVDVTSANFKPIDLAALAQADAGFKKTAFGALLTFNQSWFAQGVTLGQLLHSTSLAPGESTRIAVVDWSRKSRAGETEVIDETDDLTNDQSHNRSISEVTRAVASEAQGGFSSSKTNSHSSQSGVSGAIEMSAPFGGLFGGPSGSLGMTSSEASSNSSAESYSTSWGRRDVGSTMSQNINDRTHQHAHSNRSRRASVVKEVAQSEHESVSTRVIANYNHMHALTVQYYEVVQVYRVEVAIVRADRVVFIPFQLVDFSSDATIRRFQQILARAALSWATREALQKLETIEVILDTSVRFDDLKDTLRDFAQVTLKNQTSLSALRRRVRTDATATASVAPAATAEAAAAAPTEAAAPAAPVTVSRTFSAVAASSVVNHMNDLLWRGEQASRLAGLLNSAVLRPASTSLFLPTDVLVEGASVDAEGAAVRAVFRDGQGRILTVSSDTPMPLDAVSRISLAGSDPARDIRAETVLTLNRNGVRFPVELPAVRIAKGATGETRLVQVRIGGADINLKQHLNDNRMHYSQAVFRSLDATQTAFLLSGFGVEVAGEVVPVPQVVEPRAIRVVGNYLAFKMNSDVANDAAWAEWLNERGIKIGSAKEDIVPLATGGTFAEAVLGRSNSAEKLDITRFWNWQDSPIPLQPTEIAAIQTGSRATAEDTRPGQLSTPVVSITSPTALPDPAGTAAILAAIQNGAMFRDMSGLQATIGLAQAALQATAAGASTAGQQAGENMNNLLKANTERQRIAAEMIASLAKTAAASAYTGGAAGAGGGIGGGNHSQDGAKINYFDKTRAPSPADGSSETSEVLPSSPDAGESDGGGGGGGSGGGSWGGAGDWSANPGILAATWNDGQPPSNLVQRAMDYGFADTDGPFGLGGGSSSANPANAGAKTVAAKELNFTGRFEWDPALSDDELLKELANNRWTPATVDLRALPKGEIVASNFGHMLEVIYDQKPGSIGRINVFTHSNKDHVSFGGTIEKMVYTRAAVHFNDPSIGPFVAMTPKSLADLSQPGMKFTWGSKEGTLEDIQKRFAKNAMIVLYTCDSGQDPAFVQAVATFFQAKVVGFSDEVVWYPPNQNVPHTFKHSPMQIGITIGGAIAKDWRGLTTHAKAITATP